MGRLTGRSHGINFIKGGGVKLAFDFCKYTKLCKRIHTNDFGDFI
jgi:hypothetical protein